jgi:acetyl-CoA carboxylase biotin carboxylase subunit
LIRRLLIANRGEIATRIIRTAREMGIATVAVYSKADENLPYVRLADQAVCIGEPEPSQSYLNIERIISVAKETESDAIHPGYGFLSERAEFSEACRKAEVIFVGPPPEAMRKLGAKIESKQLAEGAGVPITPGYFKPDATDQELLTAANEIGYPVMLKASAGGGGRGMRAVADANEFSSSLALAREEAVKAFGDGAMMVEKLVDRPRHIEVQFIADTHRNVACLFERECSIQRRHQKLIEESPSPVIEAHPELWDGLRESVQKLAKAAGYVGAGTAEFIYDTTSKQFYFLEVNARLQVEHPVTETVTGLDLVEWQLRVAAGEPLGFSAELQAGDRRAMQGHAIEVRIIAEDPEHGFMPSIGKILAWHEPRGLGVRVDTGFESGSEVSRYYDSMVAKLIVHAETRDKAIRRAIAALEDFHIAGIKTNIAYMLDVLNHPQFQAGEFDTGFLGRTFPEWKPSTKVPPEVFSLAKFALAGNETASTVQVAAAGAWTTADGFRLHKGP